MDLVKADPRRTATLILNDKLELDEVPARRRSVVAVYIKELKRERLERFLKSLKDMSVKELRDIAKQFPAIKNVGKLTKAWLVKEITKAQEE